MPTIAYKLIPKSAFHFGREGLEQHSSAETFSSDSFFSALIVTVAKIDPQSIQDMVVACPPNSNSPALRISSLFPIVGELPLFPKPRIPLKINMDTDGSGKALKKIQYVSTSILKLWLANKAMDKYVPKDDASQGRYLQNGAIWITKEELQLLPSEWQNLKSDILIDKKVWDIGLAPRVTVDRMSNESNVYQTGRTVFTAECGLWFMADMVNDAVQKWLEGILTHLEDDGIGGERSSGYGAFSRMCIPLPVTPSANSDYVMLLSRYHPTAQELQNNVLDETTSYELVDIGGYMATSGAPARKRQRVRLIEAGSIVRGHITGQLADVTPTGFRQHRIYRSGIALTIPIERKAQ